MMSKYDKEAQSEWLHDEDHVAAQFKEMKPFWLALSIISVAVALAVLVVSGI